MFDVDAQAAGANGFGTRASVSGSSFVAWAFVRETVVHLSVLARAGSFSYDCCHGLCLPG